MDLMWALQAYSCVYVLEYNNAPASQKTFIQLHRAVSLTLMLMKFTAPSSNRDGHTAAFSISVQSHRLGSLFKMQLQLPLVLNISLNFFKPEKDKELSLYVARFG